MCAPAAMFGPAAFAQQLNGDELPLHTTGLEHIGMVVPDTVKAARFYSALFNPEMQKEKDDPLRYYVMTGSGYMAIGSRAGGASARIDHYCTLVEGYDRELMNARLASRGMPAANRGVVPDPDGIGLQLIAVPGGPGPTAVPGGRLVEGPSLVTPIGFDSILLKVSDLGRSSAFYSNFYNAAPAAEGQLAFEAADTYIRLRTVAAGEDVGVDLYTMRVESFEQSPVLQGLVALGAQIEEGDQAGVVTFRDPDGLRVQLRSV